MSDIARPGTPLCIVTLTYEVPVEEVDRHMTDHAAWLRSLFAEDLVIACGRRVPRTGGVIIVRGHKAEVAALAATDPFVTRGIATIAIEEFVANMAHPALADLLG